MTNHHDCHLLGKQPLFACRNGYNVAAVAVHTENTQSKVSLPMCTSGMEKTSMATLSMGWSGTESIGFPLDVPVIGIASLTDRATLPDLLDGGIENDMVDLEPTLHVKELAS